jgi:hypothetical protein
MRRRVTNREGFAELVCAWVIDALRYLPNVKLRQLMQDSAKALI